MGEGEVRRVRVRVSVRVKIVSVGPRRDEDKIHPRTQR